MFSHFSYFSAVHFLKDRIYKINPSSVSPFVTKLSNLSYALFKWYLLEYSQIYGLQT